MGNQLFKNYDVEKEPCCVGGHNGVWKIYNGVKQDSTKRKVSIWTFDKKNITDKAAKAAREEIAAFLKKEATSMMKIRHPNIVNLVEPVIEDKQSMAFVTERVDANLYDLMKHNDFQKICSSELELKLQVENILKVLQFLHCDVKAAHLGISPENIFIVNGQWKIAGFTFSTPIQQQIMADVQNIDFTKRPFDNFCTFFPNLSFCAPEVAEIPSKCCFQSDIFSLALLLLLMHQIKYMQTTSVVSILSSKTIGEYSSQLANLQNHFKTQNYIQRDLSDDFKNLLSRMLAKTPSSRPSIEQIKQSSWMNDPFVKAIYMLENIVELDQSKQISFLTGMSNILFKYEKPVIKKRIIPQLIELQKFEYLIPSILNVITESLKKPDLYSVADFQSDLSEFIVGLTKRKSIPGKALYGLVVNCETYYKYFDKNDFQNIYLIPVLKCFDIPQLQSFVLTQCDFLMGKLDYLFTKTKLLPKILLLCTSPTPKIMKQSIITLKKIIPNLDKHVLNDQVIGTLDKLRKMTITDQAITMLILEIYQQISKSLDILIIAQKILPSLIPYLIDQALGKNEFEAYLGAVNVMIKQIETERRKQIKDLESTSAAENPQVGSSSNNNNEEDLCQFEGKHVSETQPVSGKEFDFLSIFDDKPKQSVPAPAKQTATSNETTNEEKPVSNVIVKSQSIQMDFNFDMFDSMSTATSGQVNALPSNPATNTAAIPAFGKVPDSFEVQVQNENNDFFQKFKQPSSNQNTALNNQFTKIEYKDPFASQKLSQNIDSIFGGGVAKQEQPIDLFGKKDNTPFKSGKEFGFPNGGANKQNDMDLFANFGTSASTNNQQPFNPVIPQTYQSSSWGEADDPFKVLAGQNSKTFSTDLQLNAFGGQNLNQQKSNNPFDTSSHQSNKQNLNVFGIHVQPQTNVNDLFDSTHNQQQQQQQQQQSQGANLFNNLKKNNPTPNNVFDDLF